MLGLEGNDALISAEPFAVQELAHDVAQKYKLEVEKITARSGHKLSANAPLVASDFSLLERVFYNLISNPIEYTPLGGSVTLAVLSGAAGVRTMISNSGPGIAEAETSRIFEKFYQADRSWTQGVGRAGLG